jgi:predicted DNA-binding protein
MPVAGFAVGKLQCMSNDKYPQFTVRLSDKSIQQLERLALIRSRPRSEIIREAINHYSKLYSGNSF